MAEVKASDISVWNGSSWVSIKSGKVGFYNGSSFVFDRSKIRVCGGNGNFYSAENDSITINPNGVFEVLGMEESFFVTVVSNGNWIATNYDAWITVAPSSGSAGTYSVQVIVDINSSAYDSRTGQVAFACGTASAVITINQLGYKA